MSELRETRVRRRNGVIQTSEEEKGRDTEEGVIQTIERRKGEIQMSERRKGEIQTMERRKGVIQTSERRKGEIPTGDTETRIIKSQCEMPL